MLSRCRTIGRLSRGYTKLLKGVRNKELDLVVVDSASALFIVVDLEIDGVFVLSHYVCASLTKDQNGVVQWNIPKILEVMVKSLMWTIDSRRLILF